MLILHFNLENKRRCRCDGRVPLPFDSGRDQRQLHGHGLLVNSSLKTEIFYQIADLIFCVTISVRVITKEMTIWIISVWRPRRTSTSKVNPNERRIHFLVLFKINNRNSHFSSLDEEHFIVNGGEEVVSIQAIQSKREVIPCKPSSPLVEMTLELYGEVVRLIFDRFFISNFGLFIILTLWLNHPV